MANCSLSDAELWNMIVNDNHHAFTIMFQRHWFKLYKTNLYYVKDAEACEEIIHDLFLNIWKRRSYLIINDFDKYFKAAARYQVYAYLKKLKSVPVEYREQLPEEVGGYELNAADEKLSYQELEGQLNQHLRALPGRCQEIFLLSRMQQLNNSEIAEKLGISKRTVENQITRALHCIRYNMKDIVYSILLFCFAILK
jgi:RNA polymerase sigma-70 factor (family 1)